ncbi:2OG-Fe(II) oxygenase [bacterium]|nr:2OG-Fe(II) oxygenase [bacterium]
MFTNPPPEPDVQDFVAVWDNYVPATVCEGLIEQFELQLEQGYLQPRNTNHVRDTQQFVTEWDSIRQLRGRRIIEPFLERFWQCWSQYQAHYPQLVREQPWQILSMKVQKTLPAQGYHTWHYEADTDDNSRRVAAFTLYLNTVPEGGETEFLYQQRRVEAVQSRLVIWPASFTHSHRGNPPLGATKYILTGWVEH